MGAWSKAGDCSGGGKGRLHGGGKLRARDRRPAPERTRHHMTGRYLRPRNPRSAKPPVGGRGGATSGGGGSDAGGGARAIARSGPGHNAGPILPSRLLQRPFGAVCRAARWLRRPRELGLAGIVRRAALRPRDHNRAASPRVAVKRKKMPTKRQVLFGWTAQRSVPPAQSTHAPVGFVDSTRARSCSPCPAHTLGPE